MRSARRGRIRRRRTQPPSASCADAAAAPDGQDHERDPAENGEPSDAARSSARHALRCCGFVLTVSPSVGVDFTASQRRRPQHAEHPGPSLNQTPEVAARQGVCSARWGGRPPPARSSDGSVSSNSSRRRSTQLGKGTPACLAIEGEPGIGKTRLLQELSARAEQRGHLVLAGAAAEFEREMPFSVWVGCARRLCGVAGARRSTPISRSELGGVLPSLGAGGDGAIADERFRVHRAVRSAARAAGRGPGARAHPRRSALERPGVARAAGGGAAPRRERRGAARAGAAACAGARAPDRRAHGSGADPHRAGAAQRARGRTAARARSTPARRPRSTATAGATRSTSSSSRGERRRQAPAAPRRRDRSGGRRPRCRRRRARRRARIDSSPGPRAARRRGGRRRAVRARPCRRDRGAGRERCARTRSTSCSRSISCARRRSRVASYSVTR